MNQSVGQKAPSRAENQSEAPQLIVFDDACDDLEQFSSDYQQQLQNISDGSDLRPNNIKHSIISDETEKRKKQVRDKFEGFLKGQRYSEDRMKKYEEKQKQQNQGDGDMRLIKELDQIEFVQKFKRQQQQFILMFNKNPDNALNEYIKKKIIKSDSAKDKAMYLIKIEGLNKVTLGDFFGQNKPETLEVLHQYCKLLNFKGQQFDKALRNMLSKFRLPGQAQQIQRVIYQFTKVYYNENPDAVSTLDQLFPLAYSIIMLSTDAHNPKQQKKMTRQQFIKNTKFACPSIADDYLSNIYYRIIKEKFETQMSYIQTLYARLRDLSLPNLMQGLKFTKQLMDGHVFIKICRSSNKLVQRRIFLSKDQSMIMWVSDPMKYQEQPRFIKIKDITDITLGLGSTVMQKNKVPHQFDNMCFTITTTQRTLDLKARSNKQRAKWINYLRALMIQRRQTRKQELQKAHQRYWNSEQIDQIWNNDIFPSWDRHWDYKNKKPKQKGYIARGFQAVCCCINSNGNNSEGLQQHPRNPKLNIKTNLLQTLWKYGLPNPSRKTLWSLIIGNNLALTPYILDDIRKRRQQILQLQKCPFDKDVVQMAECLLVIRPDLPPVRDLLLMSDVFYKVIPKEGGSNPLICLANLIHMYHFLPFYRNDKTQIDLRIKLFQFLLEKNAKSTSSHFQILKLETKMYLVGWFLSVFANCFNGEFLYRIWDNFLLQGQIYLFKVGIALIKYYQFQLKMATFKEGLTLLKFPKNTSSVLFFEILENEIDVKQDYYDDYIEKRKQAIIKTKVQSIPLQL